MLFSKPNLNDKSTLPDFMTYSLYINKKIFGSTKYITKLYRLQRWDEFFSDAQNIKDFQLFLNNKIGQIWMKSKFGKTYQEWQER